jgi:hypothetical protein
MESLAKAESRGRRRRISEELLGSASLEDSVIEDDHIGEGQGDSGNYESNGDSTPVILRPDGAAKAKGLTPFRKGVRVLDMGGGREVSVVKQNLDDNDVESILSLIEQGKVEKLVLTQNRLSDAGAVQIAEVLKDNTSLKVLNLHGNLITKTGGMAFAESLSSNTTLTSLFLSDNPLGKEACDALSAANEQRPTPMSGLAGLVLGTAEPLRGVHAR